MAAGFSGWRLGDFVALRWADCHLDAKRPYMEARPETEKTGKLKRCYLPPQLVAPLEALRVRGGVKRLDSASVFVRTNGKLWTSRTVRKRVTKALEACGDTVPPWKRWGDPARNVKSFDFHSLKYTARSVLRELGHDVFAVNAQVGHSTLQMADLYTDVHDAELARMAQTIGAALAGQSRSACGSA